MSAGMTWAPDGRGLPEPARPGANVHLRLSAPGRHPRTACAFGLGEWWTGIPAEANCCACLEAAQR